MSLLPALSPRSLNTLLENLLSPRLLKRVQMQGGEREAE
jgi:hypothetical protein